MCIHHMLIGNRRIWAGKPVSIDLLVIAKLQSYNSDVIDFGEQLRVQHQAIWENIRWKEIFPIVQYQVSVKVSIQKNGVLR